MADRYWVGGTGTWNTTSTTNWSASTGGASGASVPTVADNVIFDQAGTYTVTMTGALACLDITVSAGTVTFATGTAPTLNVRGSMDLRAGTVWSSTGTTTFSSTVTGRTVTTNAVTLSGAVTFNGAGGGWTLGSDLTVGPGITVALSVLQGTFSTSNFNITCGTFVSTGVLTRTLNLGSSNISSGSGGAGFTTPNFTSTGITLNAGTSTFVCDNNNTFAGAGLTFANFSWVGITAGQAYAITGANTFTNFTVSGPSTAGVKTVTFDSQQTINGTLSTTGTAGNRRVFFASVAYGISEDLVVNSAPSLTDADFRGIYVTGTSAPISGTRIGDRGECRNITFDTLKTVYWNLPAGGNWSATAWASSSGGTASNDNFPLPQDIAVIENTGLNNGATVTLNASIGYISTIDMSTRTTAMTLTINSQIVYGSWKNGSGVTFSGIGTLTFQGGKTQLITSAGIAFSNSFIFDSYGGTVKLADAFSTTTQWFLSNGTFDTDGNTLTIYSLNISNAPAGSRAVYLRNSTVSLNTLSGTPDALLTFDAGTSTINVETGLYSALTYYDAIITAALALGSTGGLSGTYRNLTVTTDGNAGTFTAASTGITVTGTLSMTGASASSRYLLQSNTLGTQITVSAATVSSLSDVDFMDVAFASPVSGTRLGDAGGNSNITFASPKTVYWNLAGAQIWYATGWAATSGGAPAINNFPLPQDTAVFNNAGSVTGTITIPSEGVIGTLDASARTTAMTLAISANVNAYVYGDFKLGTGVTTSSTSSSVYFQGRGTQTITSNGRTIVWGVVISKGSFTGPPTTQLADAIVVTNVAGIFNQGGFNAVTYNVTSTNFATSSTLNMGTGTWTMTSTGTVWSAATASVITKGTANIVLSSTSTVARTFAGGTQAYNRLTIGGATGTSTTTITGNNTFTELASTKTVAHTIALGTTTQTFGAWTVTGTVGNVVTVSGTGTNHVIAGPRVSGVNYLAMGSIGFTTSPAEFYAGVNSTGTGSGVILTAAPAARTLYWRGGTGNWSDTTKWDTVSGGPGPAAIPTSADAVIFNAASNATAYTATVSGVSIARCASFNIAGPATGNVTFAGSVPIAFHGDVTVAATGVTRTYTGAINLSGNASRTFTTNAIAFASNVTVNGINSTWSLGSALNIGSSGLTVTNGSFDTSVSNYALTLGTISSANSNTRSITLNGSVVSVSGLSSSAIFISLITGLTFNAGSSQINLSSTTTGIASGGLTFNNVAFTNSASATTIAITGANTFSTLSFAGRTVTGVNRATFSANQTISTLTLNAGTTSAYRTMLQSDSIGTTRTLAVTTLTAGAADYDFRDIAITGSAAPLSVTRAGDCKGNSGITFPATKTVYYGLTTSANFGVVSPGSWSLTSGGALDDTAFPLAQDTAVFPAATYPASGSTITIPSNYNIGTIDMSLRTTNTMTLNTTTSTLTIYGNWINGTGITLSGTTNITFPGRGSQTITSAGRPFTQAFTIDTPGGSVTLQDNLVASQSLAGVLTLTKGTFDAATSNVTLSGALAGVTTSGTGTRTMAIGSGTWSIAGTTGAWDASTSTNLTITGTGTISLTNASAKTFSGGGISYSGITLDQGGAGALTISGNNTFKTITNTYSATGATSILLGTTTTTLTNPWTATGAAGNVLTVSGSSAASPGSLVYTGAGTAANVNYLSISNVRAYPLVDEWYAGNNSTNGGSLGWYFVSASTTYAVSVSESATALDAIAAVRAFYASIGETVSVSDIVAVVASIFNAASSETGRVSDQSASSVTFSSALSELARASDQAASIASFNGSLSELAQASDLASVAASTFKANTAASAQALDAVAAPGSIYNPTMSESVRALDASSAAATFPVTLSDSATITDSSAAAFTAVTSVVESARTSESTSSLMVFASNTAETARALDQVAVAASTFSAIAAASAQALDELSAPGSIYRANVSNAVSIADSLIGGFLWNPIDDSQTPSWVLVPVSQTPGWVQVDDSQTPGWQNIETS